MNTKELNKVLKTQARGLGLCDKWYEEWGKNETKQELLEKYLRGIGFCIKHDFPSLDFARENFPQQIRNQYGIFLDDHVDASNIQKAVLLGKSKGALFYNAMRSCDIYVRHTSEVEVSATDGAKVFIETYDDCKVIVRADKYSRVFVYKHGGNIVTEGNVNVRDKRISGG